MSTGLTTVIIGLMLLISSIRSGQTTILTSTIVDRLIHANTLILTGRNLQLALCCCGYPVLTIGVYG
jgi:hypothetical protein